MSRYYFDVHNGTSIVDETGSEHPDMEGVRDETRRSLVELAYSFVREKDALQLRVDVRDEAGKRVLTASIVMIMEEAEEAPPKDDAGPPTVAPRSSPRLPSALRSVANSR